MTALATKNPLFQEIADIAPVMIWIAGLDKLCNYFNRTWLEFTGRALEDELGNGWAEGVHREDFHRCLDIYEKSFDSRVSFSMEYRLRRHDGVYRWILDNGKPIYSSDNEFLGYAGSCIDITEQKEAIFALAKSEERYKFVMDIMSEGIWEFNLETNEQFVSPSYLSILGYDGSEMPPDIASKLSDLIHPDDRAQTLQAINIGIESLGRFDVEFRQRLKSGEYRWMRRRGRVLLRDESGCRPIRIIGTHSDIDKQKRAELALKESRELLKIDHDELEWIYTNAPIGLCMFDRSFRYQRINKRLAESVSLSIEEHIGKSIDEVIPELAREVRNEAQKVLLTGAPSMHNKVTQPTPDTSGQSRAFLYSCYPIYNAEGVVTGFGFVVEDITEQSHLENELKQLNVELEKKVEERTSELAEVNSALKRLSRTDALTGLNNRLAANERFRIEHSRLKRSREPYSVLVADIDHFKDVNDKFGHLVGDDVLRSISDIFAKNLRAHDFVARYGGEEFILLLPSTGLEQATIVAEKIRKAIADSPHPVAGFVTISIGIAEATAEQDNEEQVIQAADQRLYEAKNDGRNRVVAF